jgi:hypothetical protein
VAAMMYPVTNTCVACSKNYDVLVFINGDVANRDCTRDLCRGCFAKLCCWVADCSTPQLSYGEKDSQ